jgi:hypothetical protein
MDIKVFRFCDNTMEQIYALIDTMENDIALSSIYKQAFKEIAEELKKELETTEAFKNAFFLEREKRRKSDKLKLKYYKQISNR